ncbi:hypothetical protein UY3_16426 [Chelonia mydas]|uniref:Uncharacterized protein n=1 Tax=Chelonia mydas TaxID=8469 RepID=M7BE32_CHEMY|nr:hypothetical protein UY3_16426 [Chelonia mydas]
MGAGEAVPVGESLRTSAYEPDLLLAASRAQRNPRSQDRQEACLSTPAALLTGSHPRNVCVHVLLTIIFVLASPSQVLHILRDNARGVYNAHNSSEQGREDSLAQEDLELLLWSEV